MYRSTNGIHTALRCCCLHCVVVHVSLLHADNVRTWTATKSCNSCYSNSFQMAATVVANCQLAAGEQLSAASLSRRVVMCAMQEIINAADSCVSGHGNCKTLDPHAKLVIGLGCMTPTLLLVPHMHAVQQHTAGACNTRAGTGASS